MSVEEFQEHVVRILGEKAEPMYGSTLGAKLNAALGRPLSELGLGKLKEAIEAHLADRVFVNTTGIHPTFALRSAGSPGQEVAEAARDTTPSKASGTLFNVWKSPGSTYRIAVCTADGTVRLVSRGGFVDSNGGEVVLESVPPDFLSRIAREFAEVAFPPEVCREFIDAINPEDSGWWRAWDRLFEVHNLVEIRKKWLSRRHELLRQELLNRLLLLGLDSETADRARQSIEKTPSSPSRKPKTDRPEQTPLGDLNHAPSSEIRQLVFGAITQMSDRELQQLWLPVGLVHSLLRRSPR